MSSLAMMRERLFYQSLSVGVVVLVATALLMGMYRWTAEAIARAEVADAAALLRQVLPDEVGNDPLRDTVVVEGVTVHRARQGEAVRAVAFRVSERGYGGEIVVLVGIAADGRLLGARVVRHNETPGLGDKIEARKSPWIESFTGKSLADPPPARWAVRKDGGDFDQFAGATITPRAVVKAVKGALTFFAAHQEVLLQ